MAETKLIIADSEHDSNMFYATESLVPDDFIYLEKNGIEVILCSSLIRVKNFKNNIMNPENQSSIDLGGGSREVYPEINIHPEISHVPMIDGQESEIGFSSIVSHLKNDSERFELLAVSMAEEKKFVGIREFNENSILFQQDRIKDILDIVKNNPENSEEEVKKYWEEYHSMVIGYVEEFKTREEKINILNYFSGLEKSVVGSLGVIEFFKEQGFNMKFPTTEDDNRGACDLFFEKKDEKGGEYNLAVQLKSYMTDPVKNTPRDWEKRLKNAISIDRFALDKKDEKMFNKLQNHCASLRQDSGKFYHPVIVKMPVDMVKRGGSKPYELVNKGGTIQNEEMKKELDFLWEQADKVLTEMK